MLLKDNFSNVRITNLITIGAKYMAIHNGVGIKALDNLNVETHTRWSHISVFDVGGSGGGRGSRLNSNVIWIDPKIWKMETPSFTCSAPCTVKLPPWTSATSIVDFPRVTVSQGSWTSTITRPPMTVTEMLFEVVTLEAAKGGKLQARQAFSEFWPKPATTSAWPAVRYKGPDGKETRTAPPGAPPTPPTSIGPHAPPPERGSWPKHAVFPVAGVMEYPLVGACTWSDPSCFEEAGGPGISGHKNPYVHHAAPDGPGESQIHEDDEDVDCRTSTTTTTKTPEPTKKPDIVIRKAIGRAKDNTKDCYHKGRWTLHDHLSYSIESFCKILGKPGDLFDQKGTIERKFGQNVVPGTLPVEVVVSFHLLDGCEWSYDYNECRRYLHVPVDSCNCAGVNDKQGGIVKNKCYEWRVDPNDA